MGEKKVVEQIQYSLQAIAGKGIYQIYCSEGSSGFFFRWGEGALSGAPNSVSLKIKVLLFLNFWVSFSALFPT